MSLYVIQPLQLCQASKHSLHGMICEATHAAYAQVLPSNPIYGNVANLIVCSTQVVVPFFAPHAVPARDAGLHGHRVAGLEGGDDITDAVDSVPRQCG